MSSSFPIPPFSPYSPRDQSNASQSPWSASSNAGSGFDSLTLPPINSSPDPNLEYNDIDQYFDSLPRLPSPRAYLSEPSNSSSTDQQPPPSNQQARQPQLSSTGRRRSEYEVAESESPDPFEDFIELGVEYASPRREPQSWNTTRASSVVDLTESSPQPDMPPTRKRKAETFEERRSVRPRVQTPSRSSHSTPPLKAKNEIPDVVDLVDIEDGENYKDFVAKQHAETIKQQQQEEANKPVKLAEFQCIICMDNPTDLTVTHCGHLFCSECLHQALYAGTAKKCCPVCRTPVNPTASGKKQPKNGIFVLEMKLMTAKKKGKQAVRVH